MPHGSSSEIGEDLKSRMGRITEKHGPWTAMSISLGGEVATLPPASDWRLARFVHIFRDVLRRPLEGLRVLDLASLEGQYSIEPALLGATVVGIEGREDNLVKCRFAAEALGLDRCQFVQDDVRNLSAEKYGEFDVVIASGIVYHLDDPAVFEFVASIAEVCIDLAIVDTHVAARPEVAFQWRGKTYHGRYYKEHAPDATAQEKDADRWASIDNVRSVWLTKPSLLNLLTDVGFSTVLECMNPAATQLPEDRITLVAIKGSPAEVRSSPQTSLKTPPPWTETRQKYSESQDPKLLRRRKIGRWLPKPLRQTAKVVLRSVGLMEKESKKPWQK